MGKTRAQFVARRDFLQPDGKLCGLLANAAPTTMRAPSSSLAGSEIRLILTSDTDDLILW